ncbi:hypothetical protein ACA910_008973 [Epithemia clementina (nom. ined.)]
MGSIIPTQGQKHHYSIILPGAFNDQNVLQPSLPGAHNNNAKASSNTIDDDEINFDVHHRMSVLYTEEDDSSESSIDTSDHNAQSAVVQKCDHREVHKSTVISLLSEQSEEDSKRRKLNDVTDSQSSFPPKKDSTTSPNKILNNTLASEDFCDRLLLDQSRHIFALETELVRCRSSLRKWKHKNRLLQSNISLYYANNDMAIKSSCQHAMTNKDCLESASHFMNTVSSLPTRNQSNKVLNKTATEIVNILCNGETMDGQLFKA